MKKMNKTSMHRTKKLLKVAEIKGTKAVAMQVDGGKEMHQASVMTSKVLRPLSMVKSQKITFYVKKVSIAAVGALGGILGVALLVAIPVILAIFILYHSPFALFLPKPDAGESIDSITSVCVEAFLEEVETLAKDHTGYDEGEIYYRDADGDDVVSVQKQDIMCVYMVTYGMGDSAVIMTDTSKENLKQVVEDMCIYTTGERTEKRRDEKRGEYEVDILEVHVVIKNYEDMILEYGFSKEQTEMIEKMMRYITGRA